MYKDINKVLEDIRAHFGRAFSEEFEVDRQLRYVVFSQKLQLSCSCSVYSSSYC